MMTTPTIKFLESMVKADSLEQLASSDTATVLPKVVAQHSIESICFDYEITFDRFIGRNGIGVTALFTPPGRREPQLYLGLEPHFNSGSAVRVLLFMESPKRTVHFKTSSWFVDKNGKKWHKLLILPAMFSLNPGDSFPLICVDRTELLHARNAILPNDVLTFVCSITVEWEHYTDNIERNATARLVGMPGQPGQPGQPDQPQVVNVYEKMLTTGAFADFEFVLGERVFKVHKSLLSLRSPTFESMFKADAKANSAQVTDVDGDTFEKLLKYAYTDQIPDLATEKQAIAMLDAAQKYQLGGLKLLCEQALAGMLSLDSMFNLLTIADTYGAQHLGGQAKEFISSHASSQDILKALLNANLAGSTPSKTLIEALSCIIK